MKIIRRHIFETNSSHGHSWYTNGVAYAESASGENTMYKDQKSISYNLQINEKINGNDNFITITSNLGDTGLMPVYIWKKTADPASLATTSGSIVSIELQPEETYTMSAIPYGVSEGNTNVNVIGSKQNIHGFLLPPYTDTEFENSYMFQWTMSTDNVNWYDIIGANNSTYAVTYNSNNNNTDVTYYFKCLIYMPYDKNPQNMSETSVIAIKLKEP